jgi:phosphoglucosamine mutase
MSNIGFDKAMGDHGIKVVRTDVGDRHVVEEMRRHGYALGGEQSGHIIFLNRSTTGDGTLSALHVLAMLKKGGQKLSELAQCMTSYPQVLINVPVAEKRPLENMPAVEELIAQAEDQLGDDGRVLVRYSGTESKCRVMVEGPRQDMIEQLAGAIGDGISRDIGA